jgi:hypothetical protein
MGPGDEVGGRSMTPMHWTPLGSIWMVLIVRLVLPVVVNESVWIIRPVGRDAEMELGSVLLTY